MPVSQADIDRLTEAIANPEKQVALNGTQVTYRSIDELIAARDALVRQKAKEDAESISPYGPDGRLSYISQGGRGNQ